MQAIIPWFYHGLNVSSSLQCPILSDLSDMVPSKQCQSFLSTVSQHALQ